MIASIKVFIKEGIQMKVCKLIALFSLAGLASVASAESMVVNGESIEVYRSFTIDRTLEVSATNLPENAVGIYGKYAVYEGTGEVSPNVLSYIRRSEKLEGGLVLNTIDYRCKSTNIACAPLNGLENVAISTLNAKKGFYRAIIPNINTWFEAYGILVQSTEIKNFAPVYDVGVEASVQ